MKKTLLLIGLICVALVAAMVTQYQLFSFFQAIISIPLLIVLIHPFPVVFAICTIIILELFSSLPQGSIVALVAIPYLILLFWKTKQVELSWKSFFGIAFIVTVQIAALLGILAAMDPRTGLQIPWQIILAQILITSIGTFTLAFIYREFSERI